VKVCLPGKSEKNVPNPKKQRNGSKNKGKNCKKLKKCISNENFE
jgi:hypothetical protein